MGNTHIERWTAAAGIAGIALQLGGFSLFYFRAGFPPNTDSQATLAAFLRSENATIQTGILLFFAAFAVWFVFFAGLRALIAGASPGLEYLGTAIFGLGVATMTQGFIFIGMEAAAAANALTRPDNSVIYGMWMGGSVLDGAPVAVTIVGLLGVSGWALYRGRLLSRWAAWLSWAAAIVVAATVPLLYKGDDLQASFSADGLVADVLAFLPLYVWALAVSIAIFLKRPSSSTVWTRPSQEAQHG